MKLIFDHKRLHLRLIVGTGFVLFVIKKVVKRKNPEAAEAVASVGSEIKKLLKNYKRAKGHFNLVEIESHDKTCIIVKI